jgi:hypothetical protein
MTTNRYVSNFKQLEEQDLAADLIEEAIQFYGYDVQYCPRTNDAYDKVLGESPSASFNLAFPIEMYIRSIDGYSGQGQFLSNLGIEIRSQIMFSVSIRRWTEVKGQQATPENLERPREGDIIYFGLDNKLFEIKKVQKYSMFFPMGSLYTYDITCEVFEFSGENFDTGVAEIDSIAAALSIDTDEHGSIINSNPNFDPTYDFISKFADNKEINEQGAEWVDFSEDDPFSEKN